MTSVTVTDLPGNQARFVDETVPSDRGQAYRRVLIHIVGTGVNVSHAEELTQYVPNLTAIEGIAYSTSGNAVASAIPTWTGTMITYPQGNIEIGIIGRMK